MTEAVGAFSGTVGHTTITAEAFALPDISYFATHKSDRFLVDLDDIIAAHPLVGQRSPRPHNDAQVYFSNSDPRWLNATRPSDYPPIYAVADGVITAAVNPYYNLIDHTEYDPPWWHVGYGFGILIAKEGDTLIKFHYSMEPHINHTDKPKEFFKDFLLVKKGQLVKKGDLLGYMYVPKFEEKVGDISSSHISFMLKRYQQSNFEVLAPAIFTEEIVTHLGDLYQNPIEGWNSTSYGRDWSRARGIPPGMGWMIDADENPFGDYPLDVLMYDGIRDKALDGTARLDGTEIGFNPEDILFHLEGNGDFESDFFRLKKEWRVIIASVGGPKTFFTVANKGEGQRESIFFQAGPHMGFSSYASRPKKSGSYAFRISDPENWGWAIAVASSNAAYRLPGDDIPEGSCSPGCPPLP